MSPLHLSNLQDASLGSFLFLSVTITSNHSVELHQILCKRRAKKEDFTTLTAGYRPKPMMCSLLSMEGQRGSARAEAKDLLSPFKKKKKKKKKTFI